MSALEDPRDDQLRGGLRQLVVCLDEAQLLVALGWVDRQIDLQRTRPSLRGPVRVPDDDDRLDLAGDPVEIIAQVRQMIVALPAYRLLVLHKWIRHELDGRKQRE